MSRDVTPAARILVVDDNVHRVTARKMILKEQGYEVLHKGRHLHDALQTLLHREFTDELRGIRDE